MSNVKFALIVVSFISLLFFAGSRVWKSGAKDSAVGNVSTKAPHSTSLGKTSDGASSNDVNERWTRQGSVADAPPLPWVHRASAKTALTVVGISPLARDVSDLGSLLHQLERDVGLSPATLAVYRAQLFGHCAHLRNYKKDRPQPTLGPNDTSQQMRLDSWKSLVSRSDPARCASIATQLTDFESIRGEWDKAAAGGDARGLAASTVLSVRFAKDGSEVIGEGTSAQLMIPKGFTDAQLQVFLAGLSTRDPAFIESYGPVLEEQFVEHDFVFGPKKERLDQDVSAYLWDLAACQFGSVCDSAHPLLWHACAYENRCDLPDLAAYARLKLSGEQNEQLERLLPLVIDAIRTGNWNGVVARRSPPQGNGPFRNGPVLPSIGD